MVTDNVNKHLSNEMKKKIIVKEICKIFELHGWTFLSTNDFSLLESCQLYIIARYNASNCLKTEAVIQRCSGKKVFLKFLKNSQENPHCQSLRPAILIADKNRLRHRCFPVNIMKFLRTPFFIGLPLHCDKIVVKHDVHRKIFWVESIHIAIQTSKHLLYCQKFSREENFAVHKNREIFAFSRN